MTYIVRATIHRCGDLTGRCTGPKTSWVKSDAIAGWPINEAYKFLRQLEDGHLDCGCVFEVIESKEPT